MEEAKFEELAEEEGTVDIMGLKIILITMKRKLSFIMFCPHYYVTLHAKRYHLVLKIIFEFIVPCYKHNNTGPDW